MRFLWLCVAVTAGCGDDGGGSHKPLDAAIAIDSPPPAIDAAIPDVAIDAPVAGTCRIHSGMAGGGGFMDGPANVARFNAPEQIAVDAAGVVYVADDGNHRIRKIATDGSVTTLAGTGTEGYLDGPGATAMFDRPVGIAVDAAGTVYVSEYFGNRIRKIAPDGTTSTLAGNGTGGFVDGTGGPTGTTQFGAPNQITVDAAGNVYVIANNRVRKVAPDGTTTTLSGNGGFGSDDGTGGATGTATFSFPENVGGLAVDDTSTVYAVEFGSSRVRKILADGTTTTLVGMAGPGFNDGPATGAQLEAPFGMTLDGGFLYFVELSSSRVRKVAVADGTMSTPPDMCQKDNPRSIAIHGDTIFLASANSSFVQALQR